MRILQGLNERGKRHILCAKIKQIKLRKHYVWTNCPDKKKQKKIKIAFRQIVQTEEGSDRMNDAKTEILRVRMTPMEKAALSRQANNQHKTMSEYIRSIAKCPPEVTRDEFDGSILQMIYEINKIGVNINQIAKKYNEHNYVEPRADLLEKLDEVYGMMKSTIRLMKGA